MMRSLRIVADAHIEGVESAFSRLPGQDVTLRVLEANAITPVSVRDADALIVRSSTRVDAGLLRDSRVRFVATATVGDDHLDTAWLASRGIAFANAAGSSTESVVEYMVAALLFLHDQGLIDIPRIVIGVIGAGRIGARVARVCKDWGMRVLVNDPPRARREGDAGFSPLDALLEEADVLALHTPLTRAGADATWHLLGAKQLNTFRGRGVINAARGACVDNEALLAWLNTDRRRFAVLDCWEREPAPSRELAASRQVTLGTPHIAGHSLDGKANNTWFALRALCRWLGVEPAWTPAAHLPPDPAPAALTLSGDVWRDMAAAARLLYDIGADHNTMRGWLDLPPSEYQRAFSRFRRHYPVRRGWRHLPLRAHPADARFSRLARAAGMRLA